MLNISNIGVLAHVDAGKTSLTERILFHAGMIPAVGAVDSGTAHTDTMDLERQRGISIQSAVTSFTIDDRIFNLIDTPGHPDFIAEVERVVGVLDAVVLVVSAVEGVQPQTRRLSRAIANLGLPCLIFVNKIDRAGARMDALLDELSRELQRDVLRLSTVTDLGTRDAASHRRDLSPPDVTEEIANVLSRHDEALLDRFVEVDGAICEKELERSIRDQFAAANISPVLFGSAMTGAGIDALFGMLTDLVPIGDAEDQSPLSAEVFKVLRLPKGDRVLICRVWSGTLENRAVVPVHRPHATQDEEVEPGKVTGIDRFRDGEVERVQEASAGDIVRVYGLADAQIGDWLGEVIHDRVPAFEPPVFESLIEAVDPEQHIQLNAALVELADQDPLIAVRRNPDTGDIFIRLYGEVQQEVIESTLASNYDVAVTFGEPSVVCVERLRGEGRAAEIFGETKPNPPFYATVGFHIQPRRGERSSWTFTPGQAKQGYFDAAEIGARSVLDQGLYGWPVIDWDVDVTNLIFLVSSVASDYRKLAMLVMADAIRDAGTVVCEPVHDVTITTPPDSVGSVIHALSVHRGVIGETSLEGDLAIVTGTIPAAESDALMRELPGLTNGRADIDTRFCDYMPIEGDPPRRARTDLNPFDRTEFMSRLSGRF